MDAELRDLLSQLFAEATKLIESAHEAAVAGQSGALSADGYAKAARRLRAATNDATALAEAALVIARTGPGNRWESV